jgi:hypothetical protein
MGRPAETRLPVSKETRDERLKPLKRAGETYDSLLRKMAEQYDPEPEAQ